jgi:hypothetical protein
MPDLGNWGQYGVLVKDVPYGQHIKLWCKNHHECTYSTKNIAPIGARSLFYNGWPTPECSCSVDDLEVAPL